MTGLTSNSGKGGRLIDSEMIRCYSCVSPVFVTYV